MGSAPADLMRASLVLLGSALALVVAACGGGDSSSEVKGVPWRWSGLLEGTDSRNLVPIPDPENYLLRLDDDGSFIAKADCRSLSGTYTLSGNELTLEPRPSTKLACGEGSRADEYIDLLRRVSTYEVHDDGALALGLRDGGGYLYFYVSSG